MTYTIQLSRRADKMLERLDRITSQRVRDRIEHSALNPLNPQLSKEVEMSKGQRYSRVSNWRIIYEIREEKGLIIIVTIQHRSKAYKDLPK